MSPFAFFFEDWKNGVEVNWWNGGGDIATGSGWSYNHLFLVLGNIRDDSDAATPEPATLAIIGLGLAGLGVARARRRK